ncbi:hypothetical protein LINPERHAP2_LOCUS20906, partial [Linum perenne]
GGIWLLWDPYVVTLNILEFGSQFIHAKGSSADGSSFYLTTVYVSPRATARVLLWDALKRLSINQSEPWAVIGDFNAIFSTDDKVGGSPFERQRSKSFIDTCDLCRLSGPRFTWSCNCSLSRIDKALVNDEWISRMPESSVLHLHKLKSDHRPIVLCPYFRLSLLILSLFVSFLLGCLIRPLTPLLEINGMQEEAIWIHKSRSNWVVEGDRNTKFFHLVALKHRAINRIKHLKDCNGVWVEDQNELLDMAISFFGNIYTASAGLMGSLAGFT